MSGVARPAHGRIGYVELPARDAADVAASAAFYAAVFGWTVDPAHDSFEAPGTIGRWSTERAPATGTGPLLWIDADELGPALQRVESYGGTVVDRPRLDGGKRWLVEVDDPAGNRIGIAVAVRAPQSQTLLAVADVEASSRWYQELLGLRSDHGGPHYERLLAGDTLVLQLHHRDVEHHHGPIGAGRDGVAPPTGASPAEAAPRAAGVGVLVWFGEVADFDAVVERARVLGAPVVLAPHRNPPEGEGNGPAHRELWITDPDGYTVVVASTDGEAFEPR